MPTFRCLDDENVGVSLSKIPSSGLVPAGQELFLREAQCPVLWGPAQAGGSFSQAAGVLRAWGRGALGVLGWRPQDAGFLVKQTCDRQVGHSAYPVAHSPGAGRPSGLHTAPLTFLFLVINNAFNYLASYSTHITETDKFVLSFSHPVASDSPVTPWTIARQASLSTGLPRRE